MIICTISINFPAQIGPVDQRDERHPSKIDKDGRRATTPIRAIPYQDPDMEAARMKAAHEARVKIVPRV
jgi:hypothetical protein